MKKIFYSLLFWLIPIIGFAFTELVIDEYKTDVYFGNGILTKEKTAIYNAGILEKAIKHKFYNGKTSEMKKHIGKVDYAYNRTDGQIVDLLESLVQKVDGTGLESVHKAAQIAYLLVGLSTQKAHDTDLKLQVEQYKNSIEQGHKVLVVAHSQGNLFAREAYLRLPVWMHKYWEAVSIATPMNSDIKSGTPRINWDNDLVSYLAFGNSGWLDNPVRQIGWNPLKSAIGLSHREHRPDDGYAWKSDAGRKSPKGDWESSEDYLKKGDRLLLIQLL